MTTLRAARPDEHATFARLFPLLGTTDPVPSLERWAQDVSAHTLFAERDGAVVGYLYGQPLSAVGYVRHLVVAPAARGAGLGRALMLAAADGFRARGCERWCLNVRTDNAAALGLYRALGMAEAYRSTALTVAWGALAALPPSPPALVAAVITSADDAAVERRFDLPEGQLAFARAQPGRALVGLRDGDGWTAAACFDPAFPGAFPFRVSSPAAVRALLEALRPYARPGGAVVRCVIDDGDAVVDAFAAAGATVEMRMLHLEGELPAAATPPGGASARPA
ncbi:MAG: Acetyltransferase, family protein [Myxococcaceae bacterium]|nr:Acetyltransferase, family protein [Myxococcaceae bacterium]